VEVCEVPIVELQSRRRGAKKVGLVSQRVDDELEWIAAELQRALGVGR